MAETSIGDELGLFTEQMQEQKTNQDDDVCVASNTSSGAFTVLKSEFWQADLE